jgi:hypothetical protein
VSATPERLTSRWTADKLRAYGLVISVSLWSVAAWTVLTPGRIDRLGTLKGVDFSALWLSGRLVATGRFDELYDWSAWRRYFAEYFPDTPGLLFYPNYPPQAGLLFAPFGALPFSTAVLVWTLVSVALYGGACVLVWRTCRHLSGYGSTVVAVAAGSPAFFLLILNGQTTAFVLACYAGAWLAFRRGREFWMGVAFGCAAIKPHFVIVPLIVLILSGSWRAVAGILVSGLLQMAVILGVLGWDVLQGFIITSIQMIQNLDLFEPKRWQAHGLKNAIDLLLGTGIISTAIFLVVAIWLLMVAVRVWTKSAAPDAVRFALLVLVSAVLNPHLNGYDLVVLAPAFLLIADWLSSDGALDASPRVRLLLAGVYLVPLIAPIAAVTRVQLSPILLIALAWTLARASGHQVAAAPVRTAV